MPFIQVCPLSRLNEIVTSVDARDLATLINADTPVARPSGVERHFRLNVSDIVEPMAGHVAPEQSHVQEFLNFARAWDRQKPLVIHCWAGVSRSTAAAYVAAAALAPERDEWELAQTLRKISPTATPNALFVACADKFLGRSGRMSAAIAAIGRGQDCFEGTPFRLEILRAPEKQGPVF